MTNEKHTVTIGYWIEKDSRRVFEHTSCAADCIAHQTKPGRYPIRLCFEGGFLVPMPHWLLATIDTDVVGGEYFSGFGGLYHPSSKAALGPSNYTVQLHAYNLKDLISKGMIELCEGFEWAQTAHDDACKGRLNLSWAQIAEMSKK